jgi:putative ABC transport system permease protein
MDSLSPPPKWRRYLRFWRSDVAGDVDDELRFHLEARTEELVARGLSRDAAAAQALGEMGDVSAVRDGLEAIDRRVLRRRSSLEQWRVFAGELGFALRRLRDSPMFTIAATLTLAIAIGATASVFGVVDGVLLKAFPYREADRVLVIGETNAFFQRMGIDEAASPAIYLDWRGQTTSFATLAAETYQPFTATGAQEPERLEGRAVTPSYSAALGITPALGRFLSPDSGGTSEVVISAGYWQRRFGGAPSVLGQTLMLDDHPFTVVGVMPAGLAGDVDLWTRLSFTAADQINRGEWSLAVYGRLKPGVTPERAQTELETIQQQLAQAYPDWSKGYSVRTHPLLDQLVGEVRPALLMLLAAAACVLLIGAANLANLFLVRCLAREREMAVRTALGATRRRLVIELVIEAGVLALAAGGLGVGAAVAGVRVLQLLAPRTLPRLSQIGFDGRVVAFCALMSIATVFVFGVLPAWHTSRGNLADFLKESERGTGSTQHRRLQAALVVVQVAVALVLLTGAGLLVESFEHFRRLDLGVRPEGVLTAHIDLPSQRYSTPERQAAFFANVVEQLAAQPGVDAASASSTVLGGKLMRSFVVVGDPAPERTHKPNAYFNDVSPDYFRTMGITLRRGRGILPSDDARAQKVVVVDERLVRQLFASRDPIGRHLKLDGDPPDTVEIVGVVTPVRQGGLLDMLDLPEYYVPLAQAPTPSADLAVRTSGDPEVQTAAVKQAIFRIDRTVPVSDIQTLSRHVAQDVDLTRFSTFLASLFALIALILGMVGIYSVLAYIVSQRRREIAVRIALGASPSHVVGDVLRRACVLTGIGIMIGSAAAWALTRVLANLFLGVSPHDPVIFAGAVAVFAVVALAAASVPAFRTTRINPVVALTST